MRIRSNLSHKSLKQRPSCRAFRSMAMAVTKIGGKRGQIHIKIYGILAKTWVLIFIMTRDKGQSLSACSFTGFVPFSLQYWRVLTRIKGYPRFHPSALAQIFFYAYNWPCLFFVDLVYFWIIRHLVSDHFVGDPVLYCCNPGVVTQVLKNGKSYW